MVEENKDQGSGDPIKILLEKALERKRNAIMDNFAQILQRLPRGDTSASNSYFGNATPFKVQVNFEIPIFEGPHVKDWWETYCKQKDETIGPLFSATPTWDSFQDAIKEEYYPIGSYEDQYIKLITLQQGRDQDVPEFTNIFHTLRTKLGIKDSEKNLSKQSLVAELKASESDACSDPELEPNKGNGKGKQIIDAEPNAIVTITKIQKNELEDIEEGEQLFHSKMSLKGSSLQFIVDSGSQKNLISVEVVKRLGLLTAPHLQPYIIGWLHEGRDLRVRQ
eukprot:PITA_33366